MLEYLKKEADLTYTENGGVTHKSSGEYCLDLFFKAGAMRSASEKKIEEAVIRAYAENPERAMKIIFFARDVRGGLGERRFFRAAIKTLAAYAPEAVKRNLELVAEYGRWDDLLSLLGTSLEADTIELISKQLNSDIEAMKAKEEVSLLAKWLPSVNTSSKSTRECGRYIAGKLGMSECNYRKTLSSLRRYIDIIENRLRERDYSFEYEKQTSGSIFKYRKSFERNDCERYTAYLESVRKGETSIHTSTLYPYEIVRACLNNNCSKEERLSLDTIWKNLPDHGEGAENALAVVDGSGSMTFSRNSVRPIDAALSLGIYFAEHNKGAFANHFITFSQHPQLVEIKGKDIFSKVRYCRTFNEVVNTDLEAVFKLLLDTAVKNGLSQEDMPSRLYIISDMEFDGCIIGGNSKPMFDIMKKHYEASGYSLPEIVFWNVDSRNDNIPVKKSKLGSALVSGFTPALFDMIMSGNISPEKIMLDIIYSERYAAVA